MCDRSSFLYQDLRILFKELRHNEARVLSPKPLNWSYAAPSLIYRSSVTLMEERYIGSTSDATLAGLTH